MSITTLVPKAYREPRGGLYPAVMAKRVMRGVQDIRTQMGAVFDHIRTGEHVILARRGEPTAVLVPIAWYREAADAMNDPTEY